MAKLYFYYAAMNAGKTSMLLQTNHNYLERGMRTLLFVPDIVAKKTDKIASRIGLEARALAFDKMFDLFCYVDEHYARARRSLQCILVDEAHFLTKVQVYQLTDIVDMLGIPVQTYGLKTDFQGELFEGSNYLLGLADEFVELKTVCHCGRKAIMNMRTDAMGSRITMGPQVQIGGNASYIATCRYHYKKGKAMPFVEVTNDEGLSAQQVNRG